MVKENEYILKFYSVKHLSNRQYLKVMSVMLESGIKFSPFSNNRAPY